MANRFFDRLCDYFTGIATSLAAAADSAKVFPNTTDKGGSRERIYIDFLRQHVPAKCNVFQGGYLFDEDGNESRQLDVIISTDTTPRFDLHNASGSGKSFAPVEGSLGVVSIKSMLDKKELEDSLDLMNSIPYTRPLKGRHSPFISLASYDAWPLKVIFAFDGASLDTIVGHISDYYGARPYIPIGRRPEIIHVMGKYVILRQTENVAPLHLCNKGTVRPSIEPSAEYHAIVENCDWHGLSIVVIELQEYASASAYIKFEYCHLFNNAFGGMKSERSFGGSHSQMTGPIYVTPPQWSEGDFS